MSPNTSIFFHIAALIVGSLYGVEDITTDRSTENESSTSSEGGEGDRRRGS
jgi:hypothetical protein